MGAGTDPADERADRLAYFDRAEDLTPYLATEARGATYLVKTEDKHIGRSLFGKQARGEMAVLGRAVGAVQGIFGPDAIAGRTLIDVGANIGTTAIPAVISHGFGSAIAIEPEPENLRVLRLNVLLNDLEARIDVLGLAISDRLGHSDLVVSRSRGGKHWIATDPSLIKRRRGETEVVQVETVTIDHLIETGVIDPDRAGMLWMDAEAHEGHILAGAGRLLSRGTPVVLEWNPAILDRVGDRDTLERVVADNYTHFAGMHRNPDPETGSFPLQTVDRLHAYAERFLESSRKTDILVLRLEPGQVPGSGNLDEMIENAGEVRAEPGRPLPGVIQRVRGRLGRMLSRSSG